MPRSNSSFGVADGGKVRQCGARAGSRAAAAAPAGSRGLVLAEIERLAGAASAGGADRRFGRNRQLAAAERARRARRVRILAGVEGIATAAAGRRWRAALRWLLDDRRLAAAICGCDNLGWPCGCRIGWRLRRRQAPRRRWAGLPAAGRPARLRRAALKRPQPLLELPVAVLQFLVLAGELPQPVLELLDSHFQIGIIGLLRAEGLANEQHQHRGNRHGAGNSMKSG